MTLNVFIANIYQCTRIICMINIQMVHKVINKLNFLSFMSLCQLSIINSYSRIVLDFFTIKYKPFE